MTAAKLWYFGYGSNMNPQISLERRRMRPLETRAGLLEDYALCFNLPVGVGERGVANLEPRLGAQTHGVLYRLHHAQAAFLDRTEGVHRGVYRRLFVSVRAGDERISAFTYLSFRTRAGRKPSARYIGLLLGGAAHHGLPHDYRSFLAAIPLAAEERPAESAS